MAPRGNPSERITATSPIVLSMLSPFRKSTIESSQARGSIIRSFTEWYGEFTRNVPRICSSIGPYVRQLVQFMNLHILIHRQVGVTNGRVGWGRSVPRNSIEFRAGAFYRVTVAVAFSPGHRQHIRGDQIGKRCAGAVGGNVSALCLCNLQQVAAHAGQADSLRSGGAVVSSGQFF